MTVLFSGLPRSESLCSVLVDLESPRVHWIRSFRSVSCAVLIPLRFKNSHQGFVETIVTPERTKASLMS